MEVKKGYKKTEIGVFPEDWEVKNISEIAQVVGGGTPSTSNKSYWGGIINWFTPTEVGKTKYLYNSIRKITPKGLEESSAIMLEKGTILLTSRAGIGDLGILHTRASTNQGFQSLCVNDQVSNEFIYYLMLTKKHILLKNASGSTFLEISPSKVKQILIPIPPLPEQKAIATALSDMDALIAQTEKLIEKKKAMKQGMMQELLKPKKGWVTKKLGEIGFTYGGITGKSKIDFEHGESKFIPFLNVLNNTILDTDYLQNVDIKPNEIQNRVQRGDLFFNGSSETPEDLGLCSVLDKELEYVYLNSFCFGFRFYNSSISGKFLAYFFRSHFGRRSIFSLAQGATRYNLSKTNFLKLEIPLPDKNEQDNIVSVLIDLDDSISISKSKLQKLKLQKQGMMQELLTGRIRLL